MWKAQGLLLIFSLNIFYLLDILVLFYATEDLHSVTVPVSVKAQKIRYVKNRKTIVYENESAKN